MFGKTTVEREIAPSDVRALVTFKEDGTGQMRCSIVNAGRWDAALEPVELAAVQGAIARVSGVPYSGPRVVFEPPPAEPAAVEWAAPPTAEPDVTPLSKFIPENLGALAKLVQTESLTLATYEGQPDPRFVADFVGHVVMLMSYFRDTGKEELFGDVVFFAIELARSLTPSMGGEPTPMQAELIRLATPPSDDLAVPLPDTAPGE